MKSVSREQMAEVDEIVPEKYGITISRMMENAGYQIADFVRQNYSKEEKVALYAGKGNNGGDALAAARRLHLWNFEVEVVVVTEDLDGIRKEELEILRELDVPINKVPVEADVVVDGLIGYNLNGDPRSPFDTLVEAINRVEADVVSIDVPTGVDANSGKGFDPHVEADTVITLAFPKKGLEEIDAEIYVADISIPDEVYERFGVEVDGYFEEKSLIRLSQS